jgi:hypothetical protein
MIKRWNEGDNKKQDLEQLFRYENETENVKAYADFFGLTLDAYDWNHLRESDISKK